MATRRTKYTSPLADINLDSASDIIKYGDVMRQFGRSMQLELHTVADELQAVLQHSTGNVWNRAIARRKARKVTSIIRKAANEARSIAVQGVKLQRGFKKEYAELIDPPKKPKGKTINWKG